MKDTIHSPFIPTDGRIVWHVSATLQKCEVEIWQREYSLPSIRFAGLENKLERFDGLVPCHKHLQKAREWLGGAERDLLENGRTALAFQAGFSVWNKRPFLSMEIERVKKGMWLVVSDGAAENAAFHISKSDIYELCSLFGQAEREPELY